MPANSPQLPGKKPARAPLCAIPRPFERATPGSKKARANRVQVKIEVSQSPDWLGNGWGKTLFAGAILFHRKVRKAA
jgi:hypothetical protein